MIDKLRLGKHGVINQAGYFLFFCCLVAYEARAENKSSTNIQILHGSNYELGNKERTITTFEHASSWSYGDNYFFFDVTNPDQNSTGIYGEFSPSLSSSKLFNKDFSDQFIQDYRATATIETGSNFRAYLYGIGLNLRVPLFSFFKINFLLRDTANIEGKTGQITIGWRLPFSILSNEFVFTGFGDFAGSEGIRKENQLIAPQFLIDIGNFWNRGGTLYAGLEYQYWNNKAGVDGVNESVLQLMMKCFLY